MGDKQGLEVDKIKRSFETKTVATSQLYLLLLIFVACVPVVPWVAPIGTSDTVQPLLFQIFSFNYCAHAVNSFDTSKLACAPDQPVSADNVT